MLKENLLKLLGQLQWTNAAMVWYKSQPISMTFCLFSCCDSVRDISNGLKSTTGNLNHLEISRAPSKSMIAYQNINRDSSVFRDIFYMLYHYFGLQVQWQRKSFRFKMPAD